MATSIDRAMARKRFSITPTFSEQLALDHDARHRTLKASSTAKDLAALLLIVVVSAGTFGVFELAGTEQPSGAHAGQISAKSEQLNIMQSISEPRRHHVTK